MDIKVLPQRLTVCKVNSVQDIDFSKDFYFVGKTDEEISLVCDSADTPANCTDIDSGWRGFRIQGVLDFSLVGILAKIATLLADNNISIFAVSTYNTDYVLLKADKLNTALKILAGAGYNIIK